MGKHTPGPWAVWPNHDLGLDREDEIVVGMESRVIATVWPQGDDEVGIHEAVTNARLIAAAPDLLEALSEVLGPLATIPMGEGGSPEEQVPEKANLRVSEAAIHRARAAIAKAKGESA